MKSTELKYWRPGISTKALARLAAPALLAVLSMSASCGGDGEVVAQECEGTVCPCNEAGIRDAISKGGDRYTFACNGPTTVTTEAEIVIENDVVLDGEDNLIVEGGMTHRVFRVPLDVTVELRRLTIKRGGGVQQGGGVANSGLLTIRESTISDSVVDGDGAGIGAGGIHNRILGDLTLINSTVSGNGTVEGVGGGIGNDVGAKLTVIDSTVSGNATPDQGGARIANLGSAMISGGSVSGNAANYNAGGLLNEPMAVLTVVDSAVSGNTALNGRGGGIANFGGTVSIATTMVSENAAENYHGGGIYNDPSGTMRLTESTVSKNSSQSQSGGIANEGTLTIENSTISENSALYNAGGIGIGEQATVILLNSTVSGNSAGNWAGGVGGDWVPRLTLIASTVADNVASGGGSAIALRHAEALTIRNSLIVGDCYGGFYCGSTCAGNIESTGDTCGFDPVTNQVNVTAEQLNLGPLQDNGGPTLTQLPGPGSTALDEIDEESCVDVDENPLKRDQRGVARPQGPSCDVGAVEVAPEL